MKHYSYSDLHKITLLLVFFLPHQLYGQQPQNSENCFGCWFDQQTGQLEKGHIQGKIYSPELLPRFHPFFLDRTPKIGKLWMKHQHYESVLLMYDSYKDKLLFTITRPSGNIIFIEPNQALVRQFVIADHRFIHASNPTKINNFGLKKGFYEIAWQGDKLMVVIKHWKTREFENQRYYFKTWTETYLIYHQKSHTIKNKGDFIKVFPEYKKSILNFVKTEGLSIKPKNIKALVSLSKFCDRL